jgi:predicted HD superfamily hydrolase involved in NAD metabolism
MAAQKLDQIKKWVGVRVHPERYRHIRGVVATGRELAARHGLPIDKAELAGWLHDCAKELPRAEALAWIRKSPFKLDEGEKKIPALWHPHAGAAIALIQWKITDAKILEAIRYHTLGKPKMSPLAQAIFIADFIEPGRGFKGLDRVRKAARRNLREAVLLKCSMTVSYLLEKNLEVHGRLLETWKYFLDVKNEK